MSSQLPAPSYASRLINVIVVLGRRILAVFLAAYGVFDSFYDIQFIWTLRNRELGVAAMAEAASKNEQDSWGYGQILAVLIWAPVPVEYLYVVLGGPEAERRRRRRRRRQASPGTPLDKTKYIGLDEHGRNASVTET
jgi:hypothetical protein